MKRIPNLLVLVSAAVLLSAQLRADVAPVKQASVEILLVPDFLSFGTHINDAILERIGCRYQTGDARIANELMQLAIAARERDLEPSDPSARFERRTRLVFRGEAGEPTVITFSQDFINRPDLTGFWNGRPVRLDKRLYKQVRDVVHLAQLEQRNPRAPETCRNISAGASQ